MVSAAEKKKQNTNIDVIRLWLLPDDFFSLSTKAQWTSLKTVTEKAVPLVGPRKPCKLALIDDVLAVSFFLVTLGLPWILAAFWVASLWHKTGLLYMLAITVILALHPMPAKDCRKSRLALALIRYFSMEVLIDRDEPLVSGVATEAVDDPNYSSNHLPLVCLACPHGVFNYGAIIWCCISRWFVGHEQYTGAAGVVKYVPGIRYMDPLIWVMNADRKSIKSVLRERGPGRTGGMLGMVPDGILGAFRCRPGQDDLLIGKRRGLLRICAEEGATVFTSWFFGTTDMLTVVQDPFGIMESISRKLKAGVLGYYGRWYLPVPRRIAVTLAFAPYKCEKVENPSAEFVEKVHDGVYGGLHRVYDQQKVYAGYPNRTLKIE